MESLPSGLEFGKDQRIVAAVVIPAELAVPRNYDDEWVANHVGSFLVAANTQLAGFSKRSLLGLIRSVAAASGYKASASMELW